MKKLLLITFVFTLAKTNACNIKLSLEFLSLPTGESTSEFYNLPEKISNEIISIFSDSNNLIYLDLNNHKTSSTDNIHPSHKFTNGPLVINKETITNYTQSEEYNITKSLQIDGARIIFKGLSNNKSIFELNIGLDETLDIGKIIECYIIHLLVDQGYISNDILNKIFNTEMMQNLLKQYSYLDSNKENEFYFLEPKSSKEEERCSWRNVKLIPIKSRNIENVDICSGEWFIKAKANSISDLNKKEIRRIKKSAFKHGCCKIMIDVYHKFTNKKNQLYVLGIT